MCACKTRSANGHIIIMRLEYPPSLSRNRFRHNLEPASSFTSVVPGSIAMCLVFAGTCRHVPFYKQQNLIHCAAQMLRTLLNAASAATLLLLEDVDAAFAKQRTTGDGAKDRALTFSGESSECSC